VAIQTVKEYTAADPLLPTTTISLTVLIQLEIESILELYKAIENLVKAITDSGI
jgi:D-aminopeptidase